MRAGPGASPLIALEVGLNAVAMRGIDYYAQGVVNALAEVDDRNRYLVFSYFFKDYARKRARLPLPEKPNFEAAIRRCPERLVHFLERRWGLPFVERALLAGKPLSLYHVVSGGRLPRLTRTKSLVTFFDVSEEAFPERGDPDPGRRIASPRTYDVARRADCLVATGEHTKRDLMRFYAIPEEKIAVIPTGVDLRLFRPIADPDLLAGVRKRYNLPRRFFLVVGPYIPPRRTNAASVLEAFAALKREGLAGDCRLILAGSRSPPLAGLLELAARLGLAADVQATGFIPRQDLPAVYRLALAAVHPTSVEGFGFGLEILACATPFVTSNLPGVLEAVGDAALAVPPGQVRPLRDAMAALLAQPALRRDLGEQGAARASEFSYAAVARRLIALYESLLR